MADSNSPATQNSLPQDNNTATPMASSGGAQRRKLPSPQELVSHYESQGLTSHDASIKVIEDLQNALVRIISSGRGKKDKLLVDTSRKIDATNTRLAILDLKLDSKPGYAQTFALGLASGSVLNGIGAVMPHVFGAIANIWSSVSKFTKHSS
ncbi:uncharacterized protein LOC111457504 [Cucurbita moschata]|uniref:Uncharacterized protein LOC111457504 n=1 Tax=Cucurbita moschata TaxID=3662 RepID=A0A6J1GTX5_CUCMO|nr:uncharacterized protein LOC111457504 [Cucurbita moschata]